MKNIKKNNGLISKRRYVLINLLIRKEKNFLLIIAISFLLSGIFYPYPAIAMWIGFALAAYSAVANDSIQTIGTFISSNGDKKWWLLWLYIGSIFLITVTISWVINDGDVTYQRLASKGFSEAPTSFNFLQIAAPIFLLIITRLRMPVSTTFLLLSSFTTATGSILKVFEKSVIGYLIAFALAFLIWITLNKLMKGAFKGKAHVGWTVFQWVTSGFLWALWIMQDAANIAVFLPRSLSTGEFIAFGSTIFFGLGLIFFLKGDKIQQVIDEKSDVKDVRPATIIDLVYALILIWFTWVNTIPMSTTWVFIGLLGGRELGIRIRNKDKLKKTYRLILKDLAYVLIGLLISILVAIAANETLRAELLQTLNAN
tara:strand:+ start:9582 stop:10691 length:1110 start_codon:yes stop_codon:yes gene_type:complete